MTGSSWVKIPPGSHFSLANIPFGIITSHQSNTPHVAIAIGDCALDLAVFTREGGFSELPELQSHLQVFSQPTLNSFAALGHRYHRITRNYLQEVFKADTTFPNVLRLNEDLQQRALLPLREVQNHLPLYIRDYTDFYAGMNHAYNVGVLFRGPENALQPNYTHLPVGYHGRASSVVISGTPIRRPQGQILVDPTKTPKVPECLPCRKLDFELELAAFIGSGNSLGDPIDVDAAADHIFGYVLMNDWSARDIQAWEYVPLGPFNGKNFGTTISGWVVLPDALEPFKTKGIHNKNEIVPYLQEKNLQNVYDIQLEVDVTSHSGQTMTVTKTNASNLLWSFPQMLAHHTIGGCSMASGDLLASGTISGAESGSQGSLLEMSNNGKSSISLDEKETRTFLEDGDTVNIRGWAGSDVTNLVGFGDCLGLVLPVKGS